MNGTRDRIDPLDLARARDIALLTEILSVRHEAEIVGIERHIFTEWLADMKNETVHMLTRSRRAWAIEAWDRVKPFDATKVPAGRPVATPAVLLSLPKSPPGRK